ncbi:MAG: hypothetical protein J6J79_02120 [Lachnospiraceae bacterium]|nr:hypothetical protein [Lachnospiraceae bacterium]
MIDQIMNKDIKIKGIDFKVVDFAFIGCLFIFAFVIRMNLFPIESADYYGFLQKWMFEIRENGGFWSLGMEISNYTSPYMYIMTILSYISTNDLYALKLVSVLFEYIGAIAIFLIVYEITKSKRRAILGMAALLLSPTVILDGAYWCQCDMIYTCFLLYSFYYFLKDNSNKSMIFFAISFAFKLQSLFLLPFYMIMWLKRKTILLRHLLWVPVIYVASAVPAWIAGRDLKNVLSVYFSQSGYYPWGTLQYPNIYALIGEAMPDMRHAEEVSGAGLYMTVILLGCIAYYFYTKNVMLTEDVMVTLALFTVAITVYSLPHMHDRYGFFIDLLAIVYSMYKGKRLPVACGFILVSLLTFMPYLIGVTIVPIQYLAIGQLALIVYVGCDLYKQVSEYTLTIQ